MVPRMRCFQSLPLQESGISSSAGSAIKNTIIPFNKKHKERVKQKLQLLCPRQIKLRMLSVRIYRSTRYCLCWRVESEEKQEHDDKNLCVDVEKSLPLRIEASSSWPIVQRNNMDV